MTQIKIDLSWKEIWIIMVAGTVLDKIFVIKVVSWAVHYRTTNEAHEATASG